MAATITVRRSSRESVRRVFRSGAGSSGVSPIAGEAPNRTFGESNHVRNRFSTDARHRPLPPPMRNYLLDAHFQLKYTSYLLAIAVLLSLALGTLLWSVSQKVIAQSQETVKQGQETVQRGQEVVRESQKVSAVVHMNIIKDPVYGSNPELAAVFNESANEQDKRLEDQQHKLEGDAQSLQKRSLELADQQTQMFVVLIVVLSLLVVAIGIAGILSRIGSPGRSTR